MLPDCGLPGKWHVTAGRPGECLLPGPVDLGPGSGLLTRDGAGLQSVGAGRNPLATAKER